MEADYIDNFIEQYNQIKGRLRPILEELVNEIAAEDDFKEKLARQKLDENTQSFEELLTLYSQLKFDSLQFFDLMMGDLQEEKERANAYLKAKTICDDLAEETFAKIVCRVESPIEITLSYLCLKEYEAPTNPEIEKKVLSMDDMEKLARVYHHAVKFKDKQMIPKLRQRILEAGRAFGRLTKAYIPLRSTSYSFEQVRSISESIEYREGKGEDLGDEIREMFEKIKKFPKTPEELEFFDAEFAGQIEDEFIARADNADNALRTYIFARGYGSRRFQSAAAEKALGASNSHLDLLALRYCSKGFNDFTLTQKVDKKLAELASAGSEGKKPGRKRILWVDCCGFGGDSPDFAKETCIQQMFEKEIGMPRSVGMYIRTDCTKSILRRTSKHMQHMSEVSDALKSGNQVPKMERELPYPDENVFLDSNESGGFSISIKRIGEKTQAYSCSNGEKELSVIGTSNLERAYELVRNSGSFDLIIIDPYGLNSAEEKIQEKEKAAAEAAKAAEDESKGLLYYTTHPLEAIGMIFSAIYSELRGECEEEEEKPNDDMPSSIYISQSYNSKAENRRQLMEAVRAGLNLSKEAVKKGPVLIYTAFPEEIGDEFAGAGVKDVVEWTYQDYDGSKQADLFLKQLDGN